MDLEEQSQNPKGFWFDKLLNVIKNLLTNNQSSLARKPLGPVSPDLRSGTKYSPLQDLQSSANRLSTQDLQGSANYLSTQDLF
jgi:hypothetical protein